MKTIPVEMKDYLANHSFDLNSDDCAIVLDQPYLVYANSYESGPPEICEGFKELEEFLRILPLRDSNPTRNLFYRLCTTYECKPFVDGLQYGWHLMLELTEK